MSKVQTLRAFVNQRLSAAAEEILELFEGTIAEYEDELRRQRKLLASAFKPEVRLNRADIQLLMVSTEEDPTEKQDCSPSLDQEAPPELPHKEEQEELWTSLEREQLRGPEVAHTSSFTFTPVSVKIEEDDEEEPQSSQLHQSQINQIKTETGEEDYGGPEPARNLNTDDEEKPQSSQPHQSQSEQNRTEADGEDYGGPIHDNSSDFSESESDSDDLKKSSEPQSGLNFMKINSGCNTGEKSFRCTECGKQFSQNSNLKRHMRIHTGEDLFSCPVCNKRFLQRVRLTHHMARHTGEKLFSCSVCEQRFTWIYQLESHECVDRQSSQLHQSQTEESTDAEDLKTETDEDWGRPEPTRNLSPDSNLQSETDGTYDLEETRAPQSGLNPLQCNEATVSDMGTNTGKISVSSPTSFVHKVRLQKHVILQTGVKPFSCSVCGKRYPWKQSLTTHMKLHSQGKQLSCSVCKKTFRWRGEVVRHMRIHTGEKPFSCSHCGKSFSQRSSLTLHVRVHSEEKPFSCSVCKKTFRWGGEVERHMRTHTGEKPFSCPFCGMRFTQSSSLSTHLKLHTGEKPFACSVCKASFSRKANLSLHMRIHTGEKPFRCSGCDRSFTQPAHIKKHKCPGKRSSSK